MYESVAKLPCDEVSMAKFLATIVANLLPIIVIAQNILDLSITDIAFVIYFVIANELSQ